MTGALLAFDAYVHIHDAGFYDMVSTSTFSQATLSGPRPSSPPPRSRFSPGRTA